MDSSMTHRVWSACCEWGLRVAIEYLLHQSHPGGQTMGELSKHGTVHNQLGAIFTASVNTSG